MTEQAIQSKIIKKLELQGWYVLKLIKTNKNGIPDIVCFRDKEFMFIEVKKPTGILSEIQKFRIKEITEKGFICKIWKDFENNFTK